MSFISKPLQNLAAWVSAPKRCYQLREGSGEDVGLLGIKGASLCDLSRANYPVPPAFIISSEFSLEFRKFDVDAPIPEGILREIVANIHKLESISGRRFGGCVDGKLPLLVSVRGSSALPLPLWEGIDLGNCSSIQGLPDSYSTPGLMESVLNIGMNDDVASQLSKEFNVRFACDSYARFLFSFGVSVLGADPDLYHAVMQQVLVSSDTLGGRLAKNRLMLLADLQYVVQEFKKICKVPDDPMEQLVLVIRALLRVWFADTAVKLRRKIDSSSIPGTAIIVQEMVYGNLNRQSGAGVCFSRDPTTGDEGVVVHFLPNAEGDDFIMSQRSAWSFSDLRLDIPQAAQKLEIYCESLERKYKELQEISFAIEDGEVRILQARRCRCSPIASLRTITSMVERGSLSEREGLQKLDPRQMPFFLQKQVDTSLKNGMNVVSSGRPAGYGIASGHVAFSPGKVQRFVTEGKQVIYCAENISAFDDKSLSAMTLSVGVAALSGNIRSEIAVLCRGLGKSAVVGLQDVCFVDQKVELDEKTEEEEFFEPCTTVLSGAKFGIETIIREGDIVTIDGSCGQLLVGIPLTVDPSKDMAFTKVVRWADKHRNFRVFANVDDFPDIPVATTSGADGMTLSTDFLLKDSQITTLMRFYMLSTTNDTRASLLTKLFQMHTCDLMTVLSQFDGREVFVQLFDKLVSGQSYWMYHLCYQ